MLQIVKSRLNAAPVFLLLLAMAFTGANVPFGKIIVQDMSVFLFLAVRFAIASLALWLFMRAADWRAVRNCTTGDIRDIVILASVGSVLFTVFLLEGTKRTTATEAGIISATLPAMVAVLAVIVLRHRITSRGLSAIALSVLGLVVIQTAGVGQPNQPDEFASSLSFVGNGLVLVAVLCEAVFVLRSRTIAGRLSPIALSFAVSATSLALTLPLIGFEIAHVGTGAYAAIPPATWALAAWYALTASVLCTVLWYAGVGQVASWQAGLATTAIPVTAIAVAALLLGESLSLGQATGALLVIAAIVIGALPAAADRAPAALDVESADRPVDAAHLRRSDAGRDAR